LRCNDSGDGAGSVRAVGVVSGASMIGLSARSMVVGNACAKQGSADVVSDAVNAPTSVVVVIGVVTGAIDGIRTVRCTGAAWIGDELESIDVGEVRPQGHHDGMSSPLLGGHACDLLDIAVAFGVLEVE
jgi:hypothetical protein